MSLVSSKMTNTKDEKKWIVSTFLIALKEVVILSVIYQKYLQLKKEDANKLYLFKSGKFYIFVGEDCDTINDYVVLKKVKFSSESYKCGFPADVLDNYMRVFKNHNLDVEVIDSLKTNIDDSIKEKIINLDIDSITPLQALNILKDVKEKLRNTNLSNIHGFYYIS